MNQMMELPDADFKITMANVLKSPVEKVDSMHEHMRQRDGNYKKNPSYMEMLQIKSKMSEMKNSFAGLNRI